jgi:hypothetical protein
MPSRGRPVNSAIRQNIVEILFHMKKAYGYEIYKPYIAIFPKVTMRSIYYHLKKGIFTGEFEIVSVEKEKGDYSWGEFAEKIYYKLGSKASLKGNIKAKEYFEAIIKKDGE